MAWDDWVLGAATGGLYTVAKAGLNAYQDATRVDTPQMAAQQFNYNGVGQPEWDARAAQAQTRGGPFTDYQQASQARGLGLAARGAQGDALGMYRDAANGVGPSVAQAQLQRGSDAAAAQAQSLAASARGSGVQRGAATLAGIQAASGATQNAAADAAALRAQEIQQARAGYAGLAGQMRSGDAALQGQDAQQAQFQTEAALRQRGLNDAQTSAAWQMGAHASDQDQEGRIRYQTGQAGNALNANKANSENTQAIVHDAAGLVQGAVGAGTRSDERAKTDVRPAEGQLAQMLEHVKPETWEYQSGMGPKGRRAGPMAQDLERSELGASLVSRDAEGMRQVDYAKAAPALVSGLAMVHDRLSKLERGGRGGGWGGSKGRKGGEA